MLSKPILNLHNYFLKGLGLLLFLISFKTIGQTAVTRIHTDWNGYWTSNSTTGVGNRPNTENNLLAFLWNGTTYSTGVNDANLTTRGITFNAQKYRALKIQTLGLDPGSTYFLQGAMIDGSNSTATLTPPLTGTTSTGPELASRLTDGVNGLTLGTGIANIKAGTAEFKIGTNNLTISGIEDNIPDLIVTQVAEPGGTPDSFKFVDASGATVGNQLSVSFGSVTAIGTYSLDLFRADNGAMAFTAAATRDIRIVGIETKSFGITPANAAQVDRFVVTFSGNSDCAFIAFNTSSLKIAELSMIKRASISSCGKLGDTVTYTFDIKNTGEVPITNISVTDLMPGLTITGNSIPSLAAGASRTLTGTYTITAADVAAGRITNTAKVTGTDPSLNIVEDISGQTYTDNIATVIDLLAPPTIGTITNASCSSLGSVVLNNLPSGNWTLERTPGGVTTTGSGTTATVTNIPVGTSYSFRVTNSSGCKSPSSAAFNITDQSSTTWNGTAWSQGTPDLTKNVVFSGPYTITSDINACALTVNAGVNLVVPTNVTLNVLNAVSVSSTGSLTFENNSSLVQTNNVTNTGNIVYRRISKPVRRYDFTYWSSPIYSSSYTLKTLSTATLADKYYYYDSATSAWKIDYNGITVMKPGIAYSVRAPQTYSITSGATYLATFTGVPNNGNYSVATTIGKWHLVGNPYPSAISADAFINSNLHLGALYFWTHNSPPNDAVAGDAKYNYTSDDYAAYTLAGGTGTTTGADRPNGYIAAGQGIFVKSSTAAPIVFSNSMRRTGNNTQFFKTAGDTESKNRIWLNFSNSGGAFKQLLLGYMDGATNNIDDNYDAVTMNANSYIDFYSISNAKKLTIQARALPFDNTETIPLGYKTTIASDFTISINDADGFFTGQEVYLEDKLLDKIHDLRTSNYTFSSAIGTFTDRFVLRYTNKTLGNEDFESTDNALLVSVKEKIVKVNSLNENIKEVSVYDISGHLLYNKKKVNTAELIIQNLQSSNQVLLVKVTLENDHTVTKKIIFH
ncbi:T9SS sorting signal type C domain-containing protein [Flavobacterium artemisiae]|uniref:T9SS sorting signal type C domain-containing protein n=1 Tax=Flavobacterium artemisiae TaxID=2126556 RepID=A0ABW4H7Z4_9FLAO